MLNHHAGTANQETRLTPLYDVISNAYDPELSNEMAMKIGDEYKSHRVAPRDFDKLAEQTGLAKPLVRRRVPELARTTPKLLRVWPLLIANAVKQFSNGFRAEGRAA